MSQTSIYAHMRRAADAIEEAREEPLAPEADSYLDGAMRLLAHHPDGGASDSEAMMFPTPGALDTVQARLSEIIEEADDDAAAQLRQARAQILQVILLLDEQQSEGRPTSSWR